MKFGSRLIARSFALAAAGLVVSATAAYQLGAHLHSAQAATPAVAPAAPAAPAAPVIVPTPVMVPKIVMVENPAQSESAPSIDVNGAEFQFVVEVDDTPYMVLSSGKEIKRGKTRVVGEWKQAAIAQVDTFDVPSPHRMWQDRDVIVNGSCRAKVEGFAVLARLVGDPGYAGDFTEWNAKTLFEAGEVSLAAKLSACDAGYARDAELPAIVAMTPVDDAAAVAAARADFLGTDTMKRALAEYNEMSGEYAADTPSLVSVQSVRHPTTGHHWITVHGNFNEGCGGPDHNYLALYRVHDDGSVERVSFEKLEDTSAVEALIDINGDGRLERIVTDWLGMSRRLETFSGDVLKSLDTPFYGCPC